MSALVFALQQAPAVDFPSPGDLLNGLLAVVPSGLALVAVVLVVVLLQRWLDTRTDSATESRRTRSQLILPAVTALGGLLVILLLPIGDTVRGQILSLIGIVLSAGLALSFPTFLGNMLGGLMLRAVKSFRAGDFVEVEGHFGRVSERGLFHTEIQTENRELTTLPNLFLVTNPVTTVRSSGTVVSATVSHSHLHEADLEGAAEESKPALERTLQRLHRRRDQLQGMVEGSAEEAPKQT